MLPFLTWVETLIGWSLELSAPEAILLLFVLLLLSLLTGLAVGAVFLWVSRRR